MNGWALPTAATQVSREQSFNAGRQAQGQLLRSEVPLGIDDVLVKAAVAAGATAIVGGRNLEDARCIFAGDLKGPKARILLVVALASAASVQRIMAVFEN